MSDSVSQFAVLRRARASLITFAVVVGLGANTVPLAAQDKNSSSPTAPAPAESNELPDDKRLDVVVVTARKRTETLMDVPASITAISASTIEQAHMTRIDDIGSLVSNLNIFEAHDNSPAVTLRGVGSFELVQGVGFYVNDVQLFEGQIVRPVDVERIEVLKGPQGTLYGGANIGGAVKYVTKEPGAQWDNEATLEFGQYATRNYQTVLSGPILADGKLGMRVSLYDDNHAGYIYDIYRKFTFGDTYDHGGRITLLSRLDADTRIHLYLSADDLNTGNQNLLSTPPNDHTYYYTVDDYYIPSFVRRLWSSTLQVDHQFGADVALTSLTSYFASFNRGVTDFAGQPVPLDKLQQNQDHRVYSQELRLASTGRSSLDWLVGAFFERHQSQFLTIDNFSTGDVNNPIIVGGDLDRDNKTQTQYAMFADGTYHHNKWQYELGVREEYYTSAEQAHNTSIQPVLDMSAQLTGHQFSPRLSVRYQFGPTLNLYGTIARGFQPADEVEENGVIHQVRPEIATSYEVGLKSLLHHNVRLTAALFYIDYSDRLYQSLRVVPLLGLLEVTSNIGDSRNYGAEFDLTAPLPYGFKLSSGFGVTRALWANVPYIDPQTSLPINLHGRTAPFTPAYSGNISLDWTHGLGDHYRVGARVDATFIGRSYWDPQDSASQSAYHLVNVGARVENDTWTLSAYISNVTSVRFNTMYWTSYDIGGPSNYARINRPRQFTVSGSVRF